MPNKAHTAVIRRLTERYGNGAVSSNGFDVHVGDLIIEVETTVTLAAGVQRLKGIGGRRYIAMTNREALPDALAVTKGTEIGVMDPWGNIIREPGSEDQAPEAAEAGVFALG